MFNKKNKILTLTSALTIILFFTFLVPGFTNTAIEEIETPSTPVVVEDEKLTTSEYAALFQSVFQFVLGNYVDEVSPEKLFEGAMNGLFNSLEDPHTTYLTQSQLLDLTDTTEGEFGGLGIHIQKHVVGLNSDTKSKELPYVKIISPIHSTPAYRAGLKANDYITQINGESTIDLTSDDVLDKLRGVPGTDVTITILRDRVVEFDVTITRAVIQIPTVKSANIDGIGYLQISQFTHHTASQIEDVLNNFLEEDISGLIIDVRDNPGGLLNSVVEIADFFFHDGIIVSTKSRIVSENAIFEASKGVIVPEELPIAVLINGGSASASEILTGAIKDRERGVVIGNKSFGKGSVQQMRYFADSGFKITIARFYSPNDITIDKLGIEPHINVEEKTISDLTDDETLDYIRLFDERIIGNYLLENHDVTEEMILALANDILEQGYNIPEEFLINDIRTRVKRSMENPPIYDLDNDKPLIRAIEELTKE